ncbi:MAG: DUF6152 family protein [Alcaligenaceae bacterium]
MPITPLPCLITQLASRLLAKCARFSGPTHTSPSLFTASPKKASPPTLWLMEMTSPGNLVRAGGWTRTAVKKGDKVTVNFSPLRNGDKGGALKKITVADSGKVLTADIRAQERPNLQEEAAPAAAK